MSGLQEAWQDALAAEHQAAYGYGLLGPHLRGTSSLHLAVECSDAHDKLVRSTSDDLLAAGTSPVQQAADYPALGAVTSAALARALAARLENDCATAWRYLYAVAAAGRANATLRTSAQRNLTASAVRATRWSGTTTAFPGL